MSKSGDWLFPTTRWSIYLRDDLACGYCQRDIYELLASDNPDDFLVIDHVIARSRGGSHRVTNLITACFPCNNAKSNQSLKAFARREGLNISALQSHLRRRRRRDVELQRAAAKLMLGMHRGVPGNPMDLVIEHDLKAKSRWHAHGEETWSHLQAQLEMVCSACGRPHGTEFFPF